jgi:glycosyltransferase involved in cell wall biosynthesis
VPKISIVTVSFNQDKYLAECISSVVNQTYSDWELIIVDPGSTDSSRMIAQQFAKLDSRISLIFEKDAGPSDGLNKGFGQATGQIIGCLNSDDYYLPGTFNQVACAFDKFTTIDCIYAHGMILKSGKLFFQSSDKFTLKRYFSNRGLVLQQSTFFRRKSLVSKSVKFNIHNHVSWDGELIVDLASKDGKFKKVFGNWGVFRIYQESITGSKRLQELSVQNHQRMLNKFYMNGFKLSLTNKIMLNFPIYSAYRRIRNLLLYLIWLCFTRIRKASKFF